MPEHDAHVVDFAARRSSRAARVPAHRAPARPPVEPPRIGIVPDLHRTRRERSPEIDPPSASLTPHTRGLRPPQSGGLPAWPAAEVRRERSPGIGASPTATGRRERSAAAAAELSATATGAAPSRVTALRPTPITTLSQRPTAEPTPPAA